MIQNNTIIKRMIDSHPTDRIGFNENIWPYTLKKWVKDEGYPIDEQGNPISPIEHFGFDMYEISGWFDVNPLCGHEEIIEETPEWTIKRNGAGGMLKYWKDRAGTPEHIGFDMTNREVWENKYRDHLLTVDCNRFVELMSTVADRLRKKSADGFWTFYGHMCFWETMRQSLGDMCMYESLLLDPEWIHDYNRVYTDFFKLHYAKLIEEGGKPDGIWMFEDRGYKNGLVCSPDTLEKLVFPYFQEMVQFFKSYDLPVFLHSCGGIEAAIPLIVEAGFVGLHGLEVNAGCDVLRCAKQYKDKLIFVGGFQKEIIETNDIDYIRKQMTEFLSCIKDTGARYIFGSDHSISTNVKYETFKHVVEIFHKNKNY